jgi:hypothetical protein
MDFKFPILLLIIVGALSNAQLNAQSLQFSQVLTYNGSFSVSSSTITDGPIYTCPANKIWKIESLNFYKFPGSTNGSYMSYEVNGSLLGVSQFTSNAPMVVNVSLPIWLKAGDTINASFVPVSSGPSGSATYFISILEFTAP